MNKGNGPILAIIGCAVLAVVVFFLVDFSAGRSFATPQEVIEAIRQASQKDDLKAWCQCLTDDSRDLLAATVIVDEFTTRQAKGRDANAKQKAHFQAVAEVFEKHGLKDESLEKMQKEFMAITVPQAPLPAKIGAAQAILAPVKDRNAFIEDLFKTVQKLSGSEGPLSMWKNAKLADVEIRGKEAQGRVSMGRGEPKTFYFKKQGDSWKLDLFADAEMPEQMFNPHGGLPPGHP